ncbi:MAG: hypothetical protein Q7S33_05870 [Nanoarchaeota archaeon]|nr:hypothetical protein [Nanoarchaeota archaeon]
MLSENLYRLIVKDRVTRQANYDEHGRPYSEQEEILVQPKENILSNFEEPSDLEERSD